MERLPPPEERLTIVLPTYDERANISDILGALSLLYPRARIIVADDNSTDGTVDAVETMSSSNPRISLLRRDPRDRGLSASVMEGIQNTKTEFFVVMDADFQHPPASVRDLLMELDQGSDLVVAVRYNKMPLKSSRRYASGGAQGLASAYLFMKRQPRSADNMSGFFGGRTALFKEVMARKGDQFERPGFKILFDFLKFLPRKAKLAEVKFDFGERKGGESKLNSRVIISLLRQCGFLGKATATALSVFWVSKTGRMAGLIALVLIAAVLVL